MAATFEVGPGKAYASLSAVASLVGPGDVIEVSGTGTYDGGLVFAKSGTAAAPIVIRGIRDGGKRPVLSGGTTTVEFRGNHIKFEGFEVTGGTTRCIFHHGNDITVRDTLVRDCPGHGILGADSESGSLTLEYVEVRNSGSGDTRHPIYIATDEETFPGSVFKMSHCFVHDGVGGNNIKSRAERNEIRYNWVEGALYHEIELIGPDGQDESLAREDSDVVGNVFRKTTSKHFVARVGGDGTGQTFGRFRFVNNTFLLSQGSSAAVRVFDGIESLEMHNNVFYRQGGGSVQVLRDSEASWVTGSAVMSGGGNWLPSGSTNVPAAWTGTVQGDDPGFSSLDALNLAPATTSALVGAGVASPASPPGFAFPSPLALPQYLPPARTIEALGTAKPRPSGAVDIGAFSMAGATGGSTSSSTSSGAGGGGSTTTTAAGVGGGGSTTAGVGGSTGETGSTGGTDETTTATSTGAGAAAPGSTGASPSASTASSTSTASGSSTGASLGVGGGEGGEGEEGGGDSLDAGSGNGLNGEPSCSASSGRRSGGETWLAALALACAGVVARGRGAKKGRSAR